MFMFNEYATVKMKRVVSQRVSYEIGYIDSYTQDEVSTEIIIYDKKTKKQYKFYLDYNFKQKKVVLVCCANENTLTEDELTTANTMVDLLNQEIKQTIEFMYSLA